MTEDLWPPLWTMPDGTPCWCVAGDPQDDRYEHTPPCIARRNDRTLVISENWLGEYQGPSTYARSADEAEPLLFRADGWVEVYWGRGEFVYELADRLNHMRYVRLPPIQRHVVTGAVRNPAGIVALLRLAGYDNVEEGSYVNDPLKATRAEQLSLTEMNRRAGASRIEIPDQYKVHYPHLRVAVPEQGKVQLVRVELDGKQIAATRVAFDTGEDVGGQVVVKLEFIGSIELDSDVPLTVTGVDRPAG